MFWGWSPVEVHTPEYDEDGRIIRTVVQREPEFDAEQRDLFRALEAYEANLNEFGIPLDEATSIGADPGNRKGTHTYQVDDPVDWSKKAVAQQADKRGIDDPYRGNRVIRVTRVDK